jgi:hypothetical protein
MLAATRTVTVANLNRDIPCGTTDDEGPFDVSSYSTIRFIGVATFGFDVVPLDSAQFQINSIDSAGNPFPLDTLTATGPPFGAGTVTVSGVLSNAWYVRAGAHNPGLPAERRDCKPYDFGPVSGQARLFTLFLSQGNAIREFWTVTNATNTVFHPSGKRC